MLPYWPQLLLFMGAMMLIALYGLTVSGHFPAEFRGETLKGRLRRHRAMGQHCGRRLQPG